MSDTAITISRPQTGTGWLASLALAGWSGTLGTWTLDGRVWWTLVGSTLTIYRRSNAQLTDRLCAGTVDALGNVALSVLNTSGITGTAAVGLIEDATGTAIVSYATEADLEVFCPQTASFLVSDKWPTSTGGNRFELAFNEAKRILDNWLQRSATGCAVSFWQGLPDLTTLMKPRQLSQVHALLTAHVLQARSASLNIGGQGEADVLYKRAQKIYETITLQWIDTATSYPVSTSPRTQLTMRRG